MKLTERKTKQAEVDKKMYASALNCECILEPHPLTSLPFFLCAPPCSAKSSQLNAARLKILQMQDQHLKVRCPPGTCAQVVY